MSQLRVRFAPSPTGYLHVGGARTALFNYLYAKKNGGVFILRVEDTDLERSTKELVGAILDGMEWLNLTYDEGPFYQTDNFDIYKEYTQKLLKEGKAYKCYCSAEELEQKREQAMKEGKKPKYDGKCRNLKENLDKPYVIRFKAPEEGETSFNDLIKGVISFPNSELDDLIIQRTDGSPTYNFCVVLNNVIIKFMIVFRGFCNVYYSPCQI